jgi:hypothetical protein
MSREMLKVETNRGLVRLRGDLEGSDGDRHALISAFESAHAPTIEIDASAMRLTANGVELWIRIVADHLASCKLRYLSSQLTDALYYDDHYSHRESDFLGVQ